MDSASLVRDLRTRHRLSQAQLARRAGTTQARISALERGLASPGVELLERLATACGEELVLATRPRPAWHDDDADLRARFRALSMDERAAASAATDAVRQLQGSHSPTPRHGRAGS